MSAYTQFGYGGYPPPVSQILAPNTVQSPQPGDATNASRALSPVESADCRTNSAATGGSIAGAGAAGAAPSNTGVTGGADLPIAPISPDTLSQNSNAGAGGVSGVHSGAPVVGVVGVGLGTPGSSLESSNLNQVGPAGTGSCCENGRPIMTDPVSGQTVCSCQYDSARLALSGYSRLPAANVGVYGTPYPSTDQNPYQSIGVESSAFYSPLSNPYTLKDTASGNDISAWTSAGLQPTTGYYSYDPMSAYGYGASYDLAARRKNATRESTATLKAWLNEHKKNPYPTKGEKIMLAIITKMTLTQVSTWFANARRRLKKENKMTWEPKNRTDDDDEALASEDEKEKDNMETNRTSSNASMHAGGGGTSEFGSHSSADLRKGPKSEEFSEDDDRPPNTSGHDARCGLNYPTGGAGAGAGGSYSASHPHGYHPYQSHPAYYQHPMHATLGVSGYTHNTGNNCLKNENGDPKNQIGRGCGVPIPASKPKIWSLADTVASKTPPPPAYMGHPHHPQLEHQRMPHQQSGMHTSMPQPQQHTPPPVPSMHEQQSQHHHQHQQPHPHQQHQHQHQQQQQQFPSPMMSNFSPAPYYRVHTTSTTLPYGSFPGIVTTPMNSVQCNTNTNTNSNNSSGNGNSNSNPTSGTRTPLTPTPSHLLGHQQQQQQPQPQHMRPITHHPSIVSQRGMGFPEAQPDTPPQTPPNMKMPSVATKLLFSASQVPTTATYRNSNNAITHASDSPPRSKGVTALNFTAAGQYGVVSGYGAHLEDYSPRDENSSASSASCDSNSPQSQSNDNNNFKPLFKCQQIPVGGFVPHV